MLLQLRRKLTLFYTLITGLILTVVVITLAIITSQSDHLQQETLFTNQLMTIANKLQYDSKISQNWLASMERDNGLIIHIEENSQALMYAGSSPGDTDRTVLLERAREKALEESVDPHVPPVSTSLQKSSLFTITGDYGDLYQGTVMVFSSKNSYFSLILLRDITKNHQNIFYQRLLFLLADLAGIVCLFFANRKLVGHSLEPVRINEEKQHAFIAAASHELRSPLAVINASADAISSACAPCHSGTSGSNCNSNITYTDTEHFISNIKAECRRMSRLIQDLLLLASSKSNAWSLVKEKLDMDTLLLNIYEKYDPLCRAQNIHLKLELPDDSLPSILGDGERIAHILSVFLDNGIAYAPENTTFTLQAVLQKHVLSCAVIDHGPGIPEEQKEHVFEYFYRADTSRKDKNHFVLGLCVAKELAELSGGHIELKDTPGGGCTFILSLPIYPL